MKTIGASAIAWYAANPTEFSRYRGQARDKAAAKAGDKAHRRAGKAGLATRAFRLLLWVVALGVLAITALMFIRPAEAALGVAGNTAGYWPVIALGVAGSCLVLWLRGAKGRDLCRQFGISPWRYRLVATDLGGSKPKYLRDGIVVGAADALFAPRFLPGIVVGEFKRWPSRGRVGLKERYQTTLYMGMAGTVGSRRGIVCYGNGETHNVAWDKSLYRELMALSGEVIHAMKTGVALDPRPLHKRARVQ
jgi:hypothetical protein